MVMVAPTRRNSLPRMSLISPPLGGLGKSSHPRKMVQMACPFNIFRESQTHGLHFFIGAHAVSFKKVLFGAAILIIPVQGHADPGSRGPVFGLSGYWSGAGTVTMTNGATERIRCKANYTVDASGKAVQQLCAARATATGLKSAATLFPKAVHSLPPGPRRPGVCLEIYPAAPAVRRSSPR